MKSINRYVKRVGSLLVILAATSLALSSCQNNDNDIYDKDPVQRVEEAKAKLKNHLVNESEHGWIVTFFPDGGKFLGEYSLWFDFEDDYKLKLKSDMDLGDLEIEESYFNFTILRTFAISFPYHNKVHDFVELAPNVVRSDIEFMFSNYLDNGDVETTGYMTKNKVVFKKATAEEKAFNFPERWNLFQKMADVKTVRLTTGGRTFAVNYEAIPEMRMGSFIQGSSTTFTETGYVTFGIKDDATVRLVPAMEMPDGGLIEEVTWTGSLFMGVSNDGNSSIIMQL